MKASCVQTVCLRELFCGYCVSYALLKPHTIISAANIFDEGTGLFHCRSWEEKERRRKAAKIKMLFWGSWTLNPKGMRNWYQHSWSVILRAHARVNPEVIGDDERYSILRWKLKTTEKKFTTVLPAMVSASNCYNYRFYVLANAQWCCKCARNVRMSAHLPLMLSKWTHRLATNGDTQLHRSPSRL